MGDDEVRRVLLRLADPEEISDVPEVVRQVRHRVRRQRVIAAVVSAALVAVGVAGGVALVGHRGQRQSIAPVGGTDGQSAPATFVSVSQEIGEQGRVELRSSVDGKLLKVLYGPSSGFVSAARLSDDEVVVAHSTWCQGRLERVSISTGQRSPIRTIDNAVTGLTLSPDGRTAAYVTMPTPCPNPSSTGSGGSGISNGHAQFNPSVLAVTPLVGGAIQTAATDTAGHPLRGLAWSPDGSRIAATYLGDSPQVVVFSAAHPDFTTAERLPAPAGGCYFAPAWTQAGLVVADGCQGRDGGGATMLSPTRLVRLDTGATVTASWDLPACINGLDAHADATYRHVLLRMGVGYGSGVCDKEWVDRVAALSDSGLRVVLDVPNHYGSTGLSVGDW